jgi:clan AA aspartic protease (TIGR02281 family)
MRPLLLSTSILGAVLTSGFGSNEAKAYTQIKAWSKPGEVIEVDQVVANDGKMKCWLGIDSGDFEFGIEFWQNGGVDVQIITSSRIAPYTSGGSVQFVFDNGASYNDSATLPPNPNGHVLVVTLKDEGEGKEFLHNLWNGSSVHVTTGKEEANFSLTGSATAILHLHQCRYEIAPQVEIADAQAPGGSPITPQATTIPTQPFPSAPSPPAPPVPAEMPSFGGAPAYQSNGPTQVPMEVSEGAYYVNTIVNGTARVRFQIDTGATLVSIPQNIADYLMQRGTMAQDDYKGSTSFVMANGEREPGDVYMLRSISIEGVTVNDVLCSVGSDNSTILLGKSFFDKFSGFSLNKAQGTLTLTP